VVEADASGRPVPQPRWIKYGSRVLLSIIEESPADREAILEAIFTGRQDLGEKARRAYEFVYDLNRLAVV
jgi:hypothetical protein